ncbi:Orotidine 5'-phosphate decarboxylase / HUMPS family domain containing protein [Amanita muscaria]
MTHRKSYAERALLHSNPAAKQLLETIERKKSNLAVSVDLTKSADFLNIIDIVGPYICLIKTHIDILQDFDQSVIERLQHLSAKHDFMIFEDRKFADIGNTVVLQYSAGIHKIASWAHITNAHAVPGPSIIAGLATVGKPLGRGLLLLAEMSTKGSLATGSYTDEAVRMARANKDFVVGFIAQHRMESVAATESDDISNEDFLILTPGVSLADSGDSMGQQYRTPRQVITESGSDVIIVGRGVYGTDLTQVGSIASRAEHYMAEGWAAYLEGLAPIS